jgi:hypothetical protein
MGGGGEEEEPSEAIISAERRTSTVDRSIMRRCTSTLLKPDEAVCRYVKNARMHSGSSSRDLFPISRLVVVHHDTTLQHI